MGDKLENEIFKCLVKVYKVPKERIAYKYETLVLPEKEIYNLGNAELNEAVDSGGMVTGKKFGEKLRIDSMNDLEKFF